jgi:hypothetical protein
MDANARLRRHNLLRKAKVQKSSGTRTRRHRQGIYPLQKTVPNFVATLSRNRSNSEGQESPLVVREINTILDCRTRSSVPFSELIIRWSQVQILAGPPILFDIIFGIDLSSPCHFSVDYAGTPSEFRALRALL